MNEFVSSRRFHVAASGFPSDDAALLKEVGRITGGAAYDVRLRMKGDLPRTMVCAKSMSDAEDIAARLNDLGLTTIVYREEDLPPLVPFPVYRIARAGALLKLLDRRGNPRMINTADIVLLVYGRRMITSSQRELKCERRFSMRNVPMVGMPTSSLHTEVEINRAIAREDFLLAFTFDPDAAPIEFSERGIDYACMGRFIQPTKIENHRAVVKRIRKLCAGVPFDERLLAGQSTNLGEAFYNRRRAPDSSWAYATLIHWEMLASRSEPKHFTAPKREPED